MALGVLMTCVLASMLVTYGLWFILSFEYNNSPRISPSDPHDASAYALLGLVLYIGLPLGCVTGLIGAVVAFR
jgi:hypothetical protein